VHVTVSEYIGAGSQMDRLAPSIRGGLVPHVRMAAGFKGYCAFASEDGHFVSMTVFDTCRNAMRANVRLGEQKLVPGSQTTVAGETMLHEVAKVQHDDSPAMFVTVRVYDGVGPKEQVLSVVREHVFLTITGSAGFRGYYAVLNERNPSCGVAVSLFDDRIHAMEANERAVSVMRDRQIAPNPPRLMAGTTAVVAAG
jgi:hypothetical protein